MTVQLSLSSKGKRTSWRANCSNSAATRLMEDCSRSSDAGDNEPPMNLNSSPGVSNGVLKNSGSTRRIKKPCTGPSLRQRKLREVNLRILVGGRKPTIRRRSIFSKMFTNSFSLMRNVVTISLNFQSFTNDLNVADYG